MTSPVTQNVAIGAASAIQAAQVSNAAREGSSIRPQSQVVQQVQAVADKATVSAEAKSKLKTTTSKRERLDGSFEGQASTGQTSGRTKAPTEEGADGRRSLNVVA